MSATPTDATLARILCCGPLCGRPNAAEHGDCAAADYGAKKLAALRAAGFEPVDAAELLAFRATKGHAIERAEEVETLHTIADRLARALRPGVAAREAQRRYFKDRSRDNLIASKLAEGAFDQAAAAILADFFVGTFGQAPEGQGGT